jgi:hypothetical protein
MVDALLEWFKNPVLNGIGIVLAVVGLGFAVWFHLRETRVRDPRWDTRISTLIRGGDRKLDQLRIYYGEELVDTVSTSRFIFWNAGKETIDRSDVVQDDPPRIACLENTKLLDASVISVNEDTNHLNIDLVDEKTAHIEFEYLDHGHGGIIQIVHTGTEPGDVVIKGKIKGTGSVQRREVKGVKTLQFIERKFGRWGRTITMFIYMVLYLGMALVIAGFAVYFLSDISGDIFPLEGVGEWLALVWFGFIGLVWIWMCLYFIREAFRRWRGGIPRGLEDIEMDR